MALVGRSGRGRPFEMAGGTRDGRSRGEWSAGNRRGRHCGGARGERSRALRPVSQENTPAYQATQTRMKSHCPPKAAHPKNGCPRNQGDEQTREGETQASSLFCLQPDHCQLSLSLNVHRRSELGDPGGCPEDAACFAVCCTRGPQADRGPGRLRAFRPAGPPDCCCRTRSPPAGRCARTTAARGRCPRSTRRAGRPAKRPARAARSAGSTL